MGRVQHTALGDVLDDGKEVDRARAANVSADAICMSASSHTQSPHRQISQGSTLP
jgi:hypothetical protein